MHVRPSFHGPKLGSRRQRLHGSFTLDDGSGLYVRKRRAPSLIKKGGTGGGPPPGNQGIDIIYTSSASNSNVGTAETDLTSITVDHQLISPDAGSGLRIYAWGALGANANTKIIRVYFGTQVVHTRTTTGNNFNWYFEILVVRLTQTTQNGTTLMGLFGSYHHVSGVALTQDLANNVIVKLTGESNVGSNDITQHGMTIERIDAL